MNIVSGTSLGPNLPSHLRRPRAVEPVRAMRGRDPARDDAAFDGAVADATRRNRRRPTCLPPVHDGAVVTQSVFHEAFDADRETSLPYADRAYRRSEALTLPSPVSLRRVA